MAEPTTPTNYFTGGEGPGFKESVDDEKMRLLRLMAVYGSDAQKIMDDAVARTNAASGSDKDAIGTGKGPSAQAVADSRDAYDQSIALVQRLTQEAAQAQRADSLRRQSIEAIYKDSVSGDASLAATADAAIADAAAARARGRGGRGGGGGRVGREPADLTTIPAQLLDNIPITFGAAALGVGDAARSAQAENARWQNRGKPVPVPVPVPVPASDRSGGSPKRNVVTNQREQQRSTPYDTSGDGPARRTGRVQAR